MILRQVHFFHISRGSLRPGSTFPTGFGNPKCWPKGETKGCFLYQCIMISSFLCSTQSPYYRALKHSGWNRRSSGSWWRAPDAPRASCQWRRGLGGCRRSKPAQTVRAKTQPCVTGATVTVVLNERCVPNRWIYVFCCCGATIGRNESVQYETFVISARDIHRKE